VKENTNINRYHRYMHAYIMLEKKWLLNKRSFLYQKFPEGDFLTGEAKAGEVDL